MAHRRHGLKAVREQHARKQQTQKKGQEMAELEMAQMTEQLESFKTNLEAFAAKHKKQIKKHADFRQDFQRMCQQIGVDPLASNKGFWAELLGVGDFYYELGVQIVEMCLASRAVNGGLADLSELRNLVLKRRGKSLQEISEDDMERAIKKLKILGNGFKVLKVGSRKLVQSVPTELSQDHSTVLGLAENHGFTSAAKIKKELGWKPERIQAALHQLVQDGMAWVDDQAEEEREYWFPGLMRESL
eukprot:m.103279 g.103279  ORF g.103279 m.103279 type:complete len:245 (-) comp22396_c0_seq1:87-821(-)